MSQINTKPQVALIGPPNAGKSTLFNILIKTRKSLVKDQPGVTRDVLIGEAHWWGQHFTVADTGGLDFTNKNIFAKSIREQITNLLKDVKAFVVIYDAKRGFHLEDRELLKFVKKINKNIYLVVNKIDNSHDSYKLNDFYGLGKEIHEASFENHKGVPEIIEWITNLLYQKTKHKSLPQKKNFRLAVLGKPNTGKSSFCNYLLGYHRMIVTEKAGTTIDPVTESFYFKEKAYELIDTAGLRKKAKRKDHIELLSGLKAQKTIQTCDLVLYFIDSLIYPSVQDARVIELIQENYKPFIVLGNKSDLARLQKENHALDFRRCVKQILHFIDEKNLFTHLISAKTGEGIEKLFRKIEDIKEKLSIKIKTSDVNEGIREVFKRLPSPLYRNKSINLYYGTQTHQTPPSFLIFSNYPEGLKDSHKRFLVKSLKKRWSLQGIPLRLFFLKNRVQKRSFSKF